MRRNALHLNWGVVLHEKYTPRAPRNQGDPVEYERNFPIFWTKREKAGPAHPDYDSARNKYIGAILAHKAPSDVGVDFDGTRLYREVVTNQGLWTHYALISRATPIALAFRSRSSRRMSS